MNSKGKRPLRNLSPFQKIEAIERVNEGESKASVARDIQVPESTLRGWCKNVDKIRSMASSQEPRTHSPSLQSDEPPAKRQCSRISAESSLCPMPNGLDLTHPDSHNLSRLSTSEDSPVPLTTKRNPASQPAYRERRSAHGAHSAMSANYPPNEVVAPNKELTSMIYNIMELNNLANLSNNNNIPGTPLGMLNQNSRGLRSFRTPKPAHSKNNAKPNKAQQRAKLPDYYGINKLNAAFSNNCFDFKLLFENALKTTAHTFPFGQFNNATLPTTVSPFSSYEILQYYQKYNSARVPQEELMETATIPKTTVGENILHSQLTKEKHCSNEHTITSSQAQEILNGQVKKENKNKLRESIFSETPLPEGTRNRKGTRSPEEARIAEEAGRAEEGRGAGEARSEVQTSTSKEAIRADKATIDENAKQAEDQQNLAQETKRDEAERIPNVQPNEQLPTERKKKQQPRRLLLDDLLYNGSNPIIGDQMTNNDPGDSKFEKELDDALVHGDKLLKLLEVMKEPFVTHVMLGQLRTLISNLTTRQASLRARNNAQP